MKKKLILLVILIILISSSTIAWGAENKNLRADFTVKDVKGTNFKEITIIPYNRNNKDNKETYEIYLPSGYFVKAESASYVADINGTYPFTIYDGKYKNTFIFKVDDININ